MSGSKVAEIKLSPKAKEITDKLDSNTLMGELRKIAKDIKKDHALAMELWSTNEYTPRLLAILIMDKNQLAEDDLNHLAADMQLHPYDERTYLMDWLMSNHLTKDKKKIAILESWQNSDAPLQRRAFWYYLGRQRWTGKNPSDNTEELLSAIEENISKEEPEVQWAMNFVAGWIGVYDKENRERCVHIGEKTGLYKGDKVSKGCTPNYLPEFIEIEAGKREQK